VSSKCFENGGIHRYVVVSFNALVLAVLWIAECVRYTNYTNEVFNKYVRRETERLLKEPDRNKHNGNNSLAIVTNIFLVSRNARQRTAIVYKNIRQWCNATCFNRHNTLLVTDYTGLFISPSGNPNSTAQQQRQTRQKGAYQ